MNLTFRCVATLATLSMSLAATPAFPQPLTKAEIDGLIASAQEAFNIPGIAVGVVQDGELIYAQGHGLREVGRRGAVDDDTLFQVASLTKAFTAVALGLLVDAGKLDWDDRVIDHLPDFRLYDAWVTREFTVRDLLTHRSGLPLGAGDLLWWPNAESTRAEVVRALRHLAPTSSFRSKYDYDNLLYIVAGEIVGKVSGIAWEDFVEGRIFGPLGMDTCRALPERVAGVRNRATPHMVVDGELVTTFFSRGEPASAAASINCNVSGLAKWAAFHLARGKTADGRQLLSEAQHAELWRPVTPQNVSPGQTELYGTHFSAYGLGWGLSDYHGHLRVTHGGALQGMITHIALLPEKNVAAIALSNQWSRAPSVITQAILESYVTEPSRDWVEHAVTQAAERAAKNQQAMEKAVAEAQVRPLPPSLPLADYAGTYSDPWYGNVNVELDGTQLVMRFGRTASLTGPLEHFQQNTFIARWNDRSLMADSYVAFTTDFGGSVDGVEMRWVDPSTDFSFDFHHLDLKKVSPGTGQ